MLMAGKTYSVDVMLLMILKHPDTSRVSSVGIETLYSQVKTMAILHNARLSTVLDLCAFSFYG